MKMAETIARHSGTGRLLRNGETVCPVQYDVTVYQETLGPGGLPVPGLQRIEGAIELRGRDADALIGERLALALDDGRQIGIVLKTADGQIGSCGHRAFGCSCC